LCNKCKIKLEKEYFFRTDNYESDFSKNFIEHHYFFKYENLIRNQILALKFQEKPYIYKTIAYFLKNMQKSFENLKKYDIIVIVPISKQRKRDRGYNQSELFSKQISKIIKAPICKHVLFKTKNTLAQSTLNKSQREKNVKGVYNTKNIKKLVDKKILIIDDIYTTGSTVNECAQQLVQKGIKRYNIGVLTIAKD
jgi:ComF family protein